MSTHYVKSLLGVSVIAVASAGSAQAASFDRLFGFGDSLTDCCVFGPYTNAPEAWLSRLAQEIGSTHTGTPVDNYAIGGAQSGPINAISSLETAAGVPSGFQSQAQRFGASGTPVGANDLAVVWVGTNDIWPSANTSLNFPGNPLNRPLGDTPATADLVDYVADNIDGGIQDLKTAGFMNFLILSTFDVGLSTLGGSTPQVAALSRDYSVGLRDALSTYTTAGANTFFVDVLSLFDDIQADPAAFGFDPTRTTGFNNCDGAAQIIDPTFTCADLAQSEQDSYVFVDGIHLTTASYELLIDRAAASLSGSPVAPVPVPMPLALLGSGLLGLAGLRKLDARRV